MKPQTQFSPPRDARNDERPQRLRGRVTVEIPSLVAVALTGVKGLMPVDGVGKQLCGGVERRSALATATTFDRFSRIDDASQTAYAKHGSNRVEKRRKALTCRVHARVPAQSSVTASGQFARRSKPFQMNTPILSHGEQFRLNCKAAIRAAFSGDFSKVRFFLRGIVRAFKS